MSDITKSVMDKSFISFLFYHAVVDLKIRLLAMNFFLYHTNLKIITLI